MQKIRDVIRLTGAGLAQRQIAQIVGLSNGAVAKYQAAAQAAGLGWPLPEELDDPALELRLWPQDYASNSSTPGVTATGYAALDFAHIHQELKRKIVTRQLLWEEYSKVHPEDHYSYTQFCVLYRRWKRCLNPTMRLTHKAGEKLFVDYCGETVDVINPVTGEVKAAQIFVAVLGASSYAYAEATWTQALAEWIGSHARAFSFFGGVPALVVPDNLRSGVNEACKYEPLLNHSYHQALAHYGTAALPTRPYKPRDKGKVESGVQVVERWILARLRHQQFFSLFDLNLAIRQLLTDLNNRPFQKLPGSRRSQFEALDQPALRPLPELPYEYAEWRMSRTVGIDYHVEIEKHYYSVPHTLLRQKVNARLTEKTIELFHNNQRVALHVRSKHQGSHSTNAEHMPKAHRAHMEWTPGRMLNWAAQIGPQTCALVKHLLWNKPHPEMGYRSCLGLLNLARRFSAERLEAACARALELGAPTRRSVDSILKRGLDQQPIAEPVVEQPSLIHENIRGSAYYQ